MGPFTLMVCVGASWAGCGFFDRSTYPSKTECEAAKTQVVMTDVHGVVYCRPKGRYDPEPATTDKPAATGEEG